MRSDSNGAQKKGATRSIYLEDAYLVLGEFGAGGAVRAQALEPLGGHVDHGLQDAHQLGRLGDSLSDRGAPRSPRAAADAPRAHAPTRRHPRRAHRDTFGAGEPLHAPNTPMARRAKNDPTDTRTLTLPPLAARRTDSGAATRRTGATSRLTCIGGS